MGNSRTGNIKIKKQILMTLLICMVLTLIPTVAFADSAGNHTITISATSAKKKNTIDGFTYSDNYFSLDENEYHQELAQLSAGLLYASSRLKTETNAGDFLQDMGFTDIDLSAYDILPSTDTIANCIGSKKIGNSTIIAVGICGFDYEKEWASNVTVGDGERAQGFNEAAQQVIGRINKYIETYQITGQKILWVAGYSRAAATANIVAADMTDSGEFSKVFAYTFATPRTTRDKGNYTNIFNIISKDDVVPKVPLPEWGYERYGKDLYLLAQEFDSNYPAMAYKAYHAVDGEDFTNNTELADDFRTIMAYLYEIVPDATTYTTLMQENMREVISSTDTSNTLELVAEMVKALTPQTVEQEQEQNSFLSYLDMLIAKYVLYGNQQQVYKDQWIVQKGLANNLFNEHDAPTYISWMLSSEDGKGLYSDNLEFIHLTINTMADVSIYHGEDLIQTIAYDGSATYTGTGYSEDDIYLAYARNKKQVTIDLPLDQPYTVTYTPKKDENGELIAVTYSAIKVKPVSAYSTIMNVTKGVPCILLSNGDGDIHLVTKGTMLSDTQILTTEIPMSIVTQLENINVFNLSVYELVYVWMIAIGALLLQFILHLALTIYRKICHKNRSERNKDVTFFVNVALVTLLQLEVWYYAPSLPYINEFAFFISMIMMFSYASKGRNKWWLIPYGLLLVGVLIYTHYYTGTMNTVGIGLLLLKQISLAAEAWLIRKKSVPQKNNKQET